MRVHKDKINHISSLIVKDFEKREELDYKVDMNEIRLVIAKIMAEELKVDDDADAFARKTIESYSRTIREGTPEWEVMYHKHFDEYLKKHGV
jgi:hypothetical protein